jgi:uncharacterized protein (DUF58 family)
VTAAGLTFPLEPRRRLIGLSFGGMRSIRRGTGSDVAGSRPYHQGDDMDAIDWNASARLSAARDADEFVVREKFTDEAPRAITVCDRRPEMSLFPTWLPWLAKPEAVRTATLMIADSTVAVRGLTGYVDLAEGEIFWRPPRSQHEEWRFEERRPFRAPPDNLAQAFQHLFSLRPPLPTGSFIFVVSDFVEPLPDEIWLQALERRWDLVPVVVQDPVWEQSFPDIAGTSVPVLDPHTGNTSYLRLTRREVVERREQNEARWQRMLDTFDFLDIEPVILSSARPDHILDAFIWWSEKRIHWRVTL